MQTRALGRSGLEIVPVVFGGNVFGWTVDEKTSFALLDAWVDRGFDAIDTANVYSAWVPGHKGGESETIIGNWLKQSGKRDKVKIFTKVGMAMPDGGKGLRKAYIPSRSRTPCSGCRPTSSTSTSRTRTMRTRRSKRHWRPTRS